MGIKEYLSEPWGHQGVLPSLQENKYSSSCYKVWLQRLFVFPSNFYGISTVSFPYYMKNSLVADSDIAI